jgi:hypothetical protein
MAHRVETRSHWGTLGLGLALEACFLGLVSLRNLRQHTVLFWRSMGWPLSSMWWVLGGRCAGQTGGPAWP